MAKGIFTQGVCVLTDGRTTVGDVKSALQDHEFAVVRETPGSDEWCFGGPGVVVPYLPEVNGYAAVDVVSQPWPDTMGDPKSAPMVFGAWSMGQFGPLAFPGNLARARQHAWSCQAADGIAQGHRGFVRVRISYAFGGKEDAPLLPQNYNPAAEMQFLSRTVLALLTARGALCYFNPNGEMLCDRPTFQHTWDACDRQRLPPLPLWMNIRFFHLNAELGFMDTVGNGQLEVRDVEAIYPKDRYSPSDVDGYLRNVTQYLLGLGREIQTGEAIDGPGESNLTWTVDALDQGCVAPPRRVLRLHPKAIRDQVRGALQAVGNTAQ
jgi:hypothetical protein